MIRYSVYVELSDFMPIHYAYRHFKITAWLLAKKIKYTYKDVSAVIYDRKKGVVVYEK